ncbi:hypothetical protein B0T16DRAFT_496624 [Cercophora newfieldiana]|uniref:Uncharacterized protein n=1 Tax=Cercophora newfieldiana TaxID=92897 RepID=A0AA39XXR5_9PEZI|nr:hypothetical protein B0T16DRAFT_496624 [Cercophora newfieldiana]
MATTNSSDVVTSTTSPTTTPASSTKPVVPNDPEAVLPAICFTTCDNAYISANSTGLVPPLCSSSSLFSEAFNSCKACINANSPNPDAVLNSYIAPRFAPYINYCASSFGQPLIGTLLTTIAAIPATESAVLESKWSSVAAIASSGGYFVVPTELLIVTTETRKYTTTGSDGKVRTDETTRTTTIPNLSAWNYTVPAPPVTSPPGRGGGALGIVDGGDTGGGNMAWVAGPVVGCVAGITMIALGSLFWMRRRRRRREEEKARGGPPEDPLGKAQLHSDCVPRPMTPREMDGGRKTFWQLDEMSANEIPAAELPGDEVFWVRDEKLKRESGSTF